GRTAVAVSTGGMARKWPGRVGDSPLPGAGFYAHDRGGAARGTGVGEGLMRLCLCHLAVIGMAHAKSAEPVAEAAVRPLAARVGRSGGIILMDASGGSAAAFNSPFMPWARRSS